MFRRFLLIVLLLAVPSFAGVGPFTDTEDIGFSGPFGGGSTVDLGGGVYQITGGGGDVWDNWDQFHFAYKEVAGSIGFSISSIEWVSHPDWWSKAGVMIRASDAQNAVNFQTMNNSGDMLNASGHATLMQLRRGTDWGTDGRNWREPAAPKLGIQRIQIMPGLDLIESIADFGGGWEMIGSEVTTQLPATAMVGAWITGHAGWRWQLGSMKFSDPTYFEPTPLTQFPKVDNPIDRCPTVQPGFKIHSIKAPAGMELNWDLMNDLLDDDKIGPFPGTEAGTRYDLVVNLHDSDGTGDFGNDITYPGVDDKQQPTTNPAGGPPRGPDNDDQFATEVLTCIELLKGYHVIGINSDDGAILKINGIEIGRTEMGKGASTVDFVFEVLTAGKYLLEVRNLEMTGGGSLELSELVSLPGGALTRVLLGDVANGGSPVWVPEPATIVLLGLGGLSMLRMRRKS
jgi:hypothetical protein